MHGYLKESVTDCQERRSDQEMVEDGRQSTVQDTIAREYHHGTMNTMWVSHTSVNKESTLKENTTIERYSHGKCASLSHVQDPAWWTTGTFLHRHIPYTGTFAGVAAKKVGHIEIIQEIRRLFNSLLVFWNFLIIFLLFISAFHSLFWFAFPVFWWSLRYLVMHQTCWVTQWARLQH